jgi:putative ABC transport system permease protein
MLKATLKGLLSRKLRLVLSALAVVLGVMFVSGAFVLTDTLGKSFDAMFQNINENIDVRVTAKPKVEGDALAGPPVPVNIRPDVVERVQGVSGVASAEAGVFTDGARIIGKNGKVAFTEGSPQFGAGWLGEDELVQLRSGRGPTEAGEIAINAASAEASGYELGEKVPVLTVQKPKQDFTLVGIFGYSGDRDTLGGAHVVAFAMPTAQELMLGEQDVFTEISVVGDDGVSETSLRDSIKSELGGEFVVRTRDEATEADAGPLKVILNLFNYVLLGFAAVALFVGVFLILNTFSMLVAQRTRELALFRAMGASRGQVIASVLLEASIIGLIASVLGLVAGVGVGALLSWVYSTVGGAELDLQVGVPLIAVVMAFVVGLGVTLVAALFPAVRASRIPPVAAMRDAATPDKPLIRITAIGAAVFALGATALGLSLAGKGGDATLPLLLGGVLTAFAGVALLTPITSRPIVSALGWVFNRSVPGMLGRRNSARNPRRTAVTAAALMVGIALVTGVSTISGSLSKSITSTLDEQLSAELIIAGVQTGPIPPTFDRALLSTVRENSGVQAVTAYFFDVATVSGEQTFALAIDDMPAMTEIGGVQPKSGVTRTIGDGQVLVDERTAEARKLKIGDTVEAQFSRGDKRSFTLSGVYKRTPSLGGATFLFPESAAKDFRTYAPTGAYVQLRPGADVESVRKTLDRAFKDSPEVSVTDQSAFVEQQTAQLDALIVMIQILLALAIVVAVLGIVNTLALSVIERTRELGLLRAIGLLRSQTMRMITVESVVISLFGALLGLVVGVALGASVVQALKDEGFTDLAVPWGLMVIYLIAAGFTGIFAAILPAIRAARLNVLNAIAYE